MYICSDFGSTFIIAADQDVLEQTVASSKPAKRTKKKGIEADVIYVENLQKVTQSKTVKMCLNKKFRLQATLLTNTKKILT